MIDCIYYTHGFCLIRCTRCPKEDGAKSCFDRVSRLRQRQHQRPEIDPDWVEFVNATNERYKNANTDV